VVTWLDPALRRERVLEAVRRLKSRRPDVRRAILFGSLARGAGNPASDADLLLEIDAPPGSDLRAMTCALLLAMRPLPCAIDLVLRTPDQVRRVSGEPDPLLDEIEASGVLLEA
jgi:predicted nucleotidyltransferase